MSTNQAIEPLSTVLFSSARRGVLGLLYGHPDEAYYLRQIVSLTGLAIGQVQREVRQLTEAGIISRRAQGMHVWFQADDRCPIYEELRSVVSKTLGAAPLLRRALESMGERIVAAFIFGSVARGEQTQASDIDVMVVADASFRDIVAATRPATRQLCRCVNPIVYPPAEFAAKLAAGQYFLTTVMNGDKIFLIGDQHELDNLLERRTRPELLP
jgi:hypothetical protein